MLDCRTFKTKTHAIGLAGDHIRLRKEAFYGAFGEIITLRPKHHTNRFIVAIIERFAQRFLVSGINARLRQGQLIAALQGSTFKAADAASHISGNTAQLRRQVEPALNGQIGA